MRVAALAALLLSLAAGCATPADSARSPDQSAPAFAPVTAPPATFAPISDVPTTRTTSTTTSITTTTAAPATPSAAASDLLAQLVEAPESSGEGYDGALFEHWIDADGDGCNTRCEVLEAERRTDLPGLTSGWLSIYDGYSTDDPSELDVDHVVALGEAWRSGASAWDSTRRQAFANDLDEPDALIAVTASTNRSKSDRDPAEWQPPNRGAWCQFGLGWARVKVKWGLTADAAEVRALKNMLAGC